MTIYAPPAEATAMARAPTVTLFPAVAGELKVTGGSATLVVEAAASASATAFGTPTIVTRPTHAPYYERRLFAHPPTEPDATWVLRLQDPDTNEDVALGIDADPGEAFRQLGPGFSDDVS